MATVYKTFGNEDITSTRTLLHEAIPLTGTLASGTYGTAGALGSEPNIKNYAHGMFQSVYDYPYLSSSANHIYDLTLGYSSTSVFSGTADTHTQNAKKINLYTQMAQVLMGYDATGSILNFDEDGNITDGGTKSRSGFFINLARLLTKDEIKKGSFTLKLGTGSYADPFAGIITIKDSNAATKYKVNSPAGEYGILSATVGYNSDITLAPACGLIFYQAGVAFISSSVFMSGTNGIADTLPAGILTNSVGFRDNGTYLTASITGSAISASCNYLRHRIYDMSFNNTTELNSTIHFCRAGHNEFNYSSNPTYLSESKIRVKNNTLDAPIAYFTTVGLYSADNELMAVAKLSEPLKKDPANEMIVRVRLDY